MRQTIVHGLICLGSLFLIDAQAQQIKGKIIDANSKEPLPFANAFLNNTTIGTVSDVNGDFEIKNSIQPGAYELVVSFVGYESSKLKINVNTEALDVGTINLAPSEVELNSVEVKGTRDKEWEKDLKKFEKIFLGRDKNGEEATLVNPWVLDFPPSVKKKTFIAKASAPIIINNDALGYRVFFYLNYFLWEKNRYMIEGNARFNELQSADETDILRWKSNRQHIYLHSSQHLFKSMIQQRIKGEGFYLYTETPDYENRIGRSMFFSDDLGKEVMEYDTTAIVEPTEQPSIYRISLRRRVEVHYHKERAYIRAYRDISYPVSWIEFKKGFILVNEEGYPLDPEDVIVSGAMSEDRVARMLPIDYQPEGGAVDELLDFNPFQENVYVHTDKPYYYPGEPLWFKGYINYATPSWRDSLSRTMYVELINPQKAIVISKTLSIDSGFFDNDFILPDTLSAGTYALRAYTNFNRNLGDSSLYVRPIPILHLVDKVDPDQSRKNLVQNEYVEIQTDKKQYERRDKITLTIQLKDENEEPLAANLSVSVTDAAQVVPVATSATILDAFPLKPREKNNPDANFSYPVEYGISFSGKYTNAKNKSEQVMLNLVQLSNQNSVLTQANEQGIFTVNNLAFYDSAQFLIQPIDAKSGANGKAKLLPRDTPKVIFQASQKPLKLITTESPQRVVSEYEVPKDTKMLQEVVITAQKSIDEVRKRPYGKPDYVLLAKDINTTYGNLIYTLPGKFPGLIVREVYNPGEGLRWVFYTKRMISLGQPKEVLVTLNDVAITGQSPAEFLASIDPNTIKSIELTSRINVLYGSQGAGGVLAIYTKDGPNEKAVIDPQNFQTLKVPGYAPVRDFRAPDYANPDTDLTQADFRSTLYWNPEVITDMKTGTATVSFFASDLTGQYRVEVEGVTINGEPVRSEYLITVGAK